MPNAKFYDAMVYLRKLGRPFTTADMIACSREVLGAAYYGTGLHHRLEREGWLEIAGPHPNRANGKSYKLRDKPFVCPTCGRGSAKLHTSASGAPAGAVPLAPTAERLERIRSAVGDYCAHTGPPLDGDYPCADCEEIVQAVMSALSSPPSAPAASGALPHDAAEELVCLREMYQDVLRDMDSMLTDFAAALGLPDPIQGAESPGYPHILRAINVLKAKVTMGDGGACSLCGAARLYRENHWLCSNPECPASVVTALSPQASDREAEPGAMGQSRASREEAEGEGA